MHGEQMPAHPPSGVATGGSKFCQKSGKRGKKSGKRGRNREKEEKNGKVLSLCPPPPTDRAGYATASSSLHSGK